MSAPEDTAPRPALQLGGEPAFPCVEVDSADDDPVVRNHAGVSKREWLAGLALQGLIAREAGYISPAAAMIYDPLTLAHAAVTLADALLEELAR